MISDSPVHRQTDKTGVLVINRQVQGCEKIWVFNLDTSITKYCIIRSVHKETTGRNTKTKKIRNKVIIILSIRTKKVTNKIKHEGRKMIYVHTDSC